MAVFEDPSYISYHQMVIDALGRMLVGRANMTSFPYLSLVVPPFIRTMETRQCDSQHIARILFFLMDLVQTVKEHIRTYLPDILKAMEPYWETNQFEILRFIRTCSMCFYSAFKLYLVYVLPRMLSLVAADPPDKKSSTTEIIHCLLCIVPSLDNHLNVVLPVLLRFIENNHDSPMYQREGVRCLQRIVHELDVSLYTSQIIMPLLRLLSRDGCEVVQDIMDILCAVISQKQQEMYIYLNAINKVVAERKIVHPKFTDISNALYRGGVLPTLEYKFDTELDSLDQQEENRPTRASHGDTTALQQLWRQAMTLTMKDDWIDWNRRFTLYLIKESPDPCISSCYTLAQAIQPFAGELFNAAFTCMWNELSPQYRADLASSFETAFKTPQVPPEIVMEILVAGGVHGARRGRGAADE